MKLSNLTIKNYKGISNLSIDFPENKTVVLTGRNGAGKTSTLQALKFLLLGGNPGDLSKMQDLLRKGAKKGEVSARLLPDNDEIVRQIKPHKIKVNGKDDGVNEGQLEICNLVRCKKRNIDLCLNPEAFVKMDSKEQREKIWDLLKLKITAEIVADRLDLHNLTEAYFEHTELEEVVADLDGPYSTFYQARTDANREKKRCKAALEKLQGELDSSEAPEKVKKPDEESLKRASETLQGLSRVMGQAEEAKKQHERNLAKLKKLEEETGELPSWTREQAVERLRKLEADYSDQHKWIREPQRLRGELGRLSSDFCPSCKREWENLADREKKRDELENLIKEAEEKADCVKQIKARCEKGRAKIQDYDATLSARQQIAELKREIASFEPSKVDEEQLCKAQAKHEELSEQWELWQKWKVWSNRRQDLKEQLDKAESDHATLHELVNLFGPNGIKFQVFLAAVQSEDTEAATVTDSLNGILNLWDISIRFNQVLELEICRDNVWRLLDAASDGERILVSLAIQVWISEFTGLKIVCLDRLEALDEENFRILVYSLSDLLEHGIIDHAIIADVGYCEHPELHDIVHQVKLERKEK